MSESVKRKVAAVNADGTYGRWLYRVAKKVAQIDAILDEFAAEPSVG